MLLNRASDDFRACINLVRAEVYSTGEGRFALMVALSLMKFLSSFSLWLFFGIFPTSHQDLELIRLPAGSLGYAACLIPPRRSSCFDQFFVYALSA